MFGCIYLSFLNKYSSRSLSWKVVCNLEHREEEEEVEKVFKECKEEEKNVATDS